MAQDDAANQSWHQQISKGFIGKQDLTRTLTPLGTDKVAQRAVMKDLKGFLPRHGIELPRGVKANIAVAAART